MTDRKAGGGEGQPERAPRESEGLYHLLFQEMLAGFALQQIILDEDGRPMDSRFLDVNPAFERLTGLAKHQVVGKTVLEVLPGTETYWIETFGEVALTGRPAHFENYHHELGRYYEVVAFRPAEGQCAVTFTDVTERRLAERALRESERQLRDILYNVRLLAVGLDIQGRITLCNDFLLETTGWKREEVLGKSWFDLFVPPEVKLKGRFLEAIDNGAIPAHYENEILTKEGRRRLIAWNNTVLRDPEGKVLGTASIGADVTERREVEESHRKAKEAAEAASRAKSEFLANMSHEIRTPMNGVLGLLGLILDTELTREQRLYLNAAKTSADSLLRVLNDILDFSKIEAGELEFEDVVFDLANTVEEAVQALAVRAHEKRLELCCHIAPNVPGVVLGDAGRLRQVLINLLDNAVKFTSEGEVVVRVRRADKADDAGTRRVRFCVRDTGIGIAQDRTESLFESFRQADGSITRRYGGTGLGLAITQQIVERMGGEIWVDSVEGEGSTFTFELPCPTDERTTQPAGRLRPDLGRLSVLLVDDNPTTRSILRDILSDWGAVVTEATRGQQALDLLEARFAAGFPFEVVLLDSHMQGEDGFEIAGEILSSPISEEVAIAMMITSQDPVADLSRCERMGAAACLVKPVKSSDLGAALTDLLQGRVRDLAPVSERTAPAFASEDASAGRPAVPDTGLVNILLVEDNDINRMLAEALIRKRGWSVHCAADGKEAVEALKAQRFDAVLMDVQMPEMDGFQATRSIRDMEAARGVHTPIIGLTARAMEEDRERCIEAGMDDYLPKPLDPKRLYVLIEKNLPEASKPPDEAVSAPAELPALLQSVGGDRELVRCLVQRFRDDYPALLSGLLDAVKRGDRAGIDFSAHRLQGALVVFRAGRAADLASRIEQAGRDGRLDEAMETAQALKRELETLDRHLSEF